MKHTLTYNIASVSMLVIMVGLALIFVLAVCWIGIEVWRQEIKLRGERKTGKHPTKSGGKIKNHDSKN